MMNKVLMQVLLACHRHGKRCSGERLKDMCAATEESPAEQSVGVAAAHVEASGSLSAVTQE